MKVAQLIDRFIDEMNGTNGQPGLKTLGDSHLYTLRRIQRSPLGSIEAGELKKQHVIEYTKDRRKTVCAATTNQDITYLSGVLKFAPSAWIDCEDLSDQAIAAAKPLLVKYGLIGKSTPRKRTPTDQELEALLQLFASQNGHHCTKADMVKVTLFALASTRRIGEICRIRWDDIDWEKKTYMVRDVKHPTKKKGNHKTFALLPELVDIIKSMPQVEERVFPYHAKTCSARYTLAKKKLGIQGLRFHDNRREAITRWLAVLKSPHKVKLISGHETTVILERVYDATDPASINEEIAALNRTHVLGAQTLQ